MRLRRVRLAWALPALPALIGAHLAAPLVVAHEAASLRAASALGAVVVIAHLGALTGIVRAWLDNRARPREKDDGR